MTYMKTTGPEHYRKAGELAATADEVMDADWGLYASMSTEERLQRRMGLLAAAQVHATLATAAATAIGSGVYMLDSERRRWVTVAARSNEGETTT
jgi:hypothetical protein